MVVNPKKCESLRRKLYLPTLLAGLLTMVMVSVLPWLGDLGVANPKSADDLGLWINFFGQFHPVFLHLPIGALVLVLMLEVSSIVTRTGRNPNLLLGLFFTAITSVFASLFGYCLYLSGEMTGELVEEHKRDSIVLTLLVIVTFLLYYTAEVRVKAARWKAAYYLSLLLSGVMMMSAGHHGGKITHGDPMESLPSTVLEKRRAIEASRPLHADSLVVYTEVVHPILLDKCISCHGAKKQKGSLRLDTIELMLDGGEETDCLVPGSVKESSLITYLHLPLEDDLRMPPEGKPQLTAEEIKVLEWWVAEDAPEKKTLGEMKPSADMRRLIEGL